VVEDIEGINAKVQVEPLMDRELALKGGVKRPE
jgi:hypothetical protein